MHTAAMSMGCAFFPAKHSLLPVKKMDFASAMSRNEEECPLIDCMAHVCCALCNVCDSIVPFD